MTPLKQLDLRERNCSPSAGGDASGHLVEQFHHGVARG